MQSNSGLQLSPPEMSITVAKPPNLPESLTTKCSKRSKLGKLDAHIFLDHVQYTYMSQKPEVFAEFLGILDLLNKDRDVTGFLMRLSRLLFPFPELVEDVNQWLPDGFSLAYDTAKPHAIIIISPQGTKKVLSRPPRKKGKTRRKNTRR